MSAVLFKVGNIVRHIHESDKWAWKIIKNDLINNLVMVELIKDIVGEHTKIMYYKGHKEYLAKSMIILHPLYLNPKKNYQPEWL